MSEQTPKVESQRIICGVLGIVVPFGIHRFILGDTTGGIIRLVISFCFGAGCVISFIEGIIYLTKTDEEFIQTYQIGKKSWF